jgi:DNA-binding CsgD family transcriptional regulator
MHLRVNYNLVIELIPINKPQMIRAKQYCLARRRLLFGLQGGGAPIGRTALSRFVGVTKFYGGDMSSAIEKLTLREKQIYLLLLEGNNARDISLMIDISINTVQTHIKSIRRKLGIRRFSWARLYETEQADVESNQNHPLYPQNTQNGD